MLKVVRGTFVKLAFAQDAGVVLKRGDPERPAARFNPKGSDALYLSPDEESARVAIGQYVRPETRDRVLLTYELSEARLCDLRDPAASALYDLARMPWLAPLERGEEPPSWSAAERIRELGFDGLIDPSRRQPGLWHVTLFRWNEEGAPNVRRIGGSKPVTLDLDYR
ncbi:RES family NAD+ phosphorylase [Roseibium sp.]|uniref:RES family NAD+ phosphorylase n=1 Tax=Roseibium sp. TaxID=1936156 RepID=UPI003A96E64C